MTLREAKTTIRDWIKRWSDQNLTEVYAFNADGKMDYANPCCCILGVSSSLGALHVGHKPSGFRNCDTQHYSDIKRRLDLPAFVAEYAYRALGEVPHGDSQRLRNSRFSAILRAEMRLRDREAIQRSQPDELVDVI